MSRIFNAAAGCATAEALAAQEGGDEEGEEPEGEPGMTGEAKLQGTVMYMSPEQVEKDPGISFQSDLYSMGALLYECLTGTTPFQGDVVHKLLDQIRSETPEDPRKVSNLPIPESLAELTMQCLQKDPSKRPESADQFVRFLRNDWVSELRPN